MNYLSRPVDVGKFQEYFQHEGKLAGMTFVAFTQTEKRWAATYQDGDMTITFRGDVEKILSRMNDWLHRD